MVAHAVRMPTEEKAMLRAQAGVAGDKAGDNRWCETNVPTADRVFEEHLRVIEKERTERG